ncbi:hypothetical protein [Pseudomarimonas arenosa]|uniref:ApeA N-terminal domain-containing protein n=1 Tax=Pseudomarimonas arenosa TaxID=2774145 RepID=A0AAW3ZE47_9GAMM|nr:hypothetical protein [Pseudomarimonas arenosa]MBD8524431.1 hypothetical protein [Pseudomarimonas arenosa]
MDKKEQDALFHGTFEIPLADCELRQLDTDEPRVYAGPALLTQRQDKSLHLRLFAAPRGEIEGIREFFDALEVTPGKIHPDSNYYDFTGVDQHGVTWKAERLSIECSYGVNSTYVQARVRAIEASEDYGNKVPSSTAHAFVPGTFKLPWHKVTKTESSIKTDIFEGESERYAWKLHQREDQLDISFTVKGGPVGDDFWRFLGAISVLCGTAIDPVLVMIGEAGKRIRRLRTQRRPGWTASLARPLSDLAPDAAHSHHFIARYLRGTKHSPPAEQDSFDTLQTVWHRTLRTASDLDIGPLVIGVNIEAVVMDLFASEVDMDTEFIDAIEKAKDIVQRSGMAERVKHRALSSLGGAVKPGPKQVLTRIQEQGFITANEVKAWVSLRNHAAHGGDVDDSSYEALQGAVDKYYRCLGLFYRLLFVVVGYRGQHRDFTAPGWPIAWFGDGPPAIKGSVA